ncbi:hypothetical protein [Niallia taxi]|uniref:hypothetical protein n=1 Tax=Niallia taxi TaxID=2499688 RepID=UPI0015F6C09C|nr:hypothetical protein [Niallia taxi]
MKLTEIDQIEKEYSTGYDEKHSKEILNVLSNIAKQEVATDFAKKYGPDYFLGDLSIDYTFVNKNREKGFLRKRLVPYKVVKATAIGKVYRKEIS